MADSKPAVLQAAGSALAAEVASRARPNVKLIGLLALGHFVADHYGLPVALWISALMPLAGFAAARVLPAPRHVLIR
jgi:hypothetical protein